ncbi:YbaK/EbsC family protein [Sulfitobacter sp. D35]|uniref:YbaK/EbsC family protein n=1 Tax=Sulfitobacter sp. D35 TaxID=3083252 RepID=UPI00296FF5B4|nr:YbaK/EbsC family protein [Sulfitobacter sp. D35]MDW4497686.1 YbaK/EbsC family protein [Sulfitobacter sp. D35]
MSKSLRRVRAALEAADVAIDIRETALARTAADAALAVGCEVDQIAKSIVFRGEDSGGLYLFITAGAQKVDPDRAARLAGEALGKAEAHLIRERTGFAIGGVAPIGHLERVPAFFDRTLLDFEEIWAAAGTPHHVFCVEPAVLVEISFAQVSDFTALREKM